ncbi:endolytic transglycosylase MltG [Streptomyces sp. NPDC051976]|uniref:endolytic transglycosylase MltG n=1 Tax=Streptomyces sp. NPDC051976 TaxID=3154947 RepID=UPI00341C2591
MTDYGRGSGSEPWHPEDPLFGDRYDQAQQPHPPQQPQQQYQGGWDDPYATGQHPQQQYPQHQGQQQYQPQSPQQPQYQQQYPQQQGQPQQQYPQHNGQQQYQQARYDGGYDTGSHPVGGYGGQDPYGGHQPQDPYSTGQQPDFYGQQGYPPPQQPQYRQQPGQPQQPMQGQRMRQGAPAPAAHPQEPGAQPLRTAPDTTGDWDAEAEDDPREHAFFADRDDDDDEDDTSVANSGGRRSGKTAGKGTSKGGKKRRSGCACLVVVMVLAGGLGGAGYFGYEFYQSHFGPAPDYTGSGSGEVQVQIPTGSTLTTMGNILKNAGVVKSVDAFTSAARKNPKGQFIQAGVYVLNRNMSAAAAVTMMLDPKSQNAMIVSEGMRDAQIYAAIDKRLGLADGATLKVARAQAKNLGLPDWADTNSKIKDPLEGFLFPSRYSVAKGMKPETLLREMIGEAKKQFAAYDLAAEAKKQGLKSPLELLTVASLVQAEGKTNDDFRKMAKVVYNRLVPTNKETYGILQFDSTYNYIKNQNETKLNLEQMRQLDDPYNTYKYKGLPPGPIGNPGLVALKAAMSPDSGNWYYFISLDGKTTKFTETQAEFNKLKANYHP